MTDNPSQALTQADAAAAISRAISFWADSTTRPETFERIDKLKDKIQAVATFFAFSGKHTGEITPEDVRLTYGNEVNGTGHSIF